MEFSRDGRGAKRRERRRLQRVVRRHTVSHCDINFMRQAIPIQSAMNTISRKSFVSMSRAVWYSNDWPRYPKTQMATTPNAIAADTRSTEGIGIHRQANAIAASAAAGATKSSTANATCGQLLKRVFVTL